MHNLFDAYILRDPGKGKLVNISGEKALPQSKECTLWLFFMFINPSLEKGLPHVVRYVSLMCL